MIEMASQHVCLFGPNNADIRKRRCISSPVIAFLLNRFIPQNYSRLPTFLSPSDYLHRARSIATEFATEPGIKPLSLAWNYIERKHAPAEAPAKTWSLCRKVSCPISKTENSASEKRNVLPPRPLRIKTQDAVSDPEPTPDRGRGCTLDY